ncbi:MAG: glycosyltransferase [Chloroflexi bacterium]|nr:glycosyltransferase [Chloroflexota bacterium]
MRVALFGPVHPFRGGIAHYTTLLNRTLLEEGHTVLLVSFSRMYPRWLFPGASDRDPSTTPLHASDPNYWIDSLNPFTWLTTFARLRRFQPDVIVFSWWTPFFVPLWYTLALLNQLFLRRELAILCHNVLPHEDGWVDRLLARGVLGWADRLVVQSEREKCRLLALLPGADVVVVPHPVYDMWADRRIPQTEARARLGLPIGIPIFLFFGIIRQYKGLDTLLDALPHMQTAIGDLLLLIAGEFWDDKEVYAQKIRRLGLEKTVRIDDHYIPDEEVALYFSAADLLVAPYLSVTGSGVIQMAAGFGVPVVTTAAFDPAAHHPASHWLNTNDPRQIAVTTVEVLSAIHIGKQTGDAEDNGADPQASWRCLVHALVGKEI